MKKIVVFISGRGSNLTALADACGSGFCEATITTVISDRYDAPGLEVASQRGLPTLVIQRKDYRDSKSFEDVIDRNLNILSPDWIVLAGFMRILGAAFVKKYEGKIVNIHPSLLPSFTGLETHDRALMAGVRWHGATVHFVNDQLDGGPIIAQAAVPVYLGDSKETLGNRVLKAEHKLLPKVMSYCVKGKIYLDQGKVVYDSSLIEKAMSC